MLIGISMQADRVDVAAWQDDMQRMVAETRTAVDQKASLEFVASELANKAEKRDLLNKADRADLNGWWFFAPILR
jgi:hypothetical protein